MPNIFNIPLAKRKFAVWQRHDIKNGKINGESASIPDGVLDDWLQNIWPKLRIFR